MNNNHSSNVNPRKCCGRIKPKEVKSAFRALKNAETPIPTARVNFKVSFNDEQFDLSNEYNNSTSSFIAKEAGIYLFTATLSFNPTDDNVDYEFGMNLVINGDSQDVEADYTGFNAVFFNVVDLSEIVKLNKGDKVEIFALSTTPGTVTIDQRSSFAGAKLF
ncbi:C1q-like domain-containing protein [Jeotgalibacillus campisalis]|uniref:C1q domain-containing protein n=1 Tax=Jeotgalibacillus campisalis TaxID=220754 RepID=A0A0C2R014_9BACL|nr:hypothetical protein [Jeotgalibacillus campisalis]KIL43655.1 hypothetical protein KR50_31750 [Jeotgalibacillus campisalis]